MNFFRSFAVLVVACFLVFVGCAPTQQWLEPRVCDCPDAAADECGDSSTEIASAVVDHQIDHAHYRADVDVEQAARDLERMAEQEDETPYRDPEELAEEPINPVISDTEISFDDDEDRDFFEETYNVELTDSARVFRANFTAAGRTTVAIFRPGRSLEIADESGSVASLELDAFDDRPVPRDEVTDYALGPVELVQDGTHQIKLIHARADEDGGLSYYIGLYKFIGSRIGTIFERPLAVETDDGEVRRLADIQFLHGVDNRRIRWIGLSDDGDPVDEFEDYHWNRWEGVYRLPEPPPTAPERLRSERTD